ncbi:MUC3B protein, partial [Menura novaehollandiae]|nr:MUC3B protein [Menura novaehollandiae]
PPSTDPCQNGGRWMGTGCLCPPNVDGARCEFGATTINLTAGKGGRGPPPVTPHAPRGVPMSRTPLLPAELGPFVTMMARVTNRDFSEDMGDTSSPGHRRFAEEFSRTVRPSRGSVVVNFRVRLQPPPGNASLEHRALELLTVANAAAQPRNCSPSANGLCFTATSARAARAATPELNDTELCRRHAPANFSQFYFPLRTANGLLCVTNCTLNVPGSFDCHRG